MADVRAATALLLCVGDELTSGDVENTNASWLARRLAELGVRVVLAASVPDEVERIGTFLAAHRDDADHVVVTGGLGATPDDVTREGVAAAFGVACELHAPTAEALRGSLAGRLADHASRWATLPAGCVPIANPTGGAPGFAIRNVVVLPGVPDEMRATFEAVAGRFVGSPIHRLSLRYELAESDVLEALRACRARFPAVALGSYPNYAGGRKRVELVLKSQDAALLETASAWLAAAIAGAR